MLGKLMKHESVYMARRFVPLYLIYIALAVLARVAHILDFTDVTNVGLSFALNMGMVLVLIAFFLACFGLALMGLFLNVARFRSNLFTDEGYLMNTLPLPSWYHIVCKLLSGIIWFVLTMCVAVAGVFIGFYDMDDFEIFSELLEISIEVFHAAPLETALIIILAVVTFCAFVLLCYFGQAFSSMVRHKRIVGFVIIIGCVILDSFLSTTLSEFYFAMADSSSISAYLAVNIVYHAAAGGLLFWLTNLILRKRLNLQ
ncbi:MAG: hypothetical protein LIO40_07195 [Ruminococcus sp.]|nr:hypothetical protein [Ruminococcus sp.]